MTHLFEKLTKTFTTRWNSCELTVIRIGALMSINSCFTDCANVILARLQTGYRFQPLQPSISEKTVVGILCPSTLSCETKNFFKAAHLDGILFKSTSSANSQNVCFGLKSVNPLFFPLQLFRIFLFYSLFIFIFLLF